MEIESLSLERPHPVVFCTGFAVSGSAESLGAKVTSSVVKSIFMVIVVDGIFALYFAAVDF